MERKIGETFRFEGKTLQVKEIEEHTCEGCFFKDNCVRAIVNKEAGECLGRVDKKNVIFVEAPEPASQEETKLNLCEILKYCPQGETFWSPMLNGVKFLDRDDERQMIVVETVEGHFTWEINADGTISIDNVISPEIMLYPSKEQRDWTTVKYEKKELPKTWEEFCETHEVQKGEAYITDISTICIAEYTGDTRDMYADKNILPSEEEAEAHLALMQLHQLRDCWREGWVPDWNDGDQDKYVIVPNDGEFKIYEYHTIRRFLAFQDEKRADEFKDCFIDLIRKAGDFI